MRENAFAHEGAAQRANHRKRKKSHAQEIDREKFERRERLRISTPLVRKKMSLRRTLS